MSLRGLSVVDVHTVKRLAIAGLLFILSPLVFALTPVARFDLVPFQRVDQGQVFNVGVVAFSKAGISDVTFTVAGQGYAGPNPQIASSMTYNARTDVYEYWVPLRASDFASDGVFTVSAVVTGQDGGSRALDPVPLVVNATGNLPQPEAWVSLTGSDGTGAVGDPTRPFRTVSAAIGSVQSSNGGRADGAIVYLEEGEYELGNANVSTTDEWLTFARAAGASRDNVIVHGGGSVTDARLLRFYELTLRSDGSNDKWLQGWPDPAPTWLWVDSSRVVGSGRWTNNSSPVFRHDNWFCTDTYITNVDIAIRFADIVRNVDIENIGDDASFLSDMVINLTVHNQDPNINENGGTPTYDHADGWQWAGAGMDNQIVYGYYSTDTHVQGIFARMSPNGGVHRNSAFVNVLIEMRYPRRPGDSGDQQSQFDTVSFYGPMDHIIMWHCTFPVGRFGLFDEPMGLEFSMTNSSFVGNVFNVFIDWDQANTSPVPYGAPGNKEGNEFLHNHYISSYVDDQQDGYLWSKSPDTDSSVSQSIGDPHIVSNLDAADYGTPSSGSPLVDRLSREMVPNDVHGNRRDSSPDVGAIEFQGMGGRTPRPAAPSGLRVR